MLTSIAVNYVAESTRGKDTAILYVCCDYKNSLTHSVNALLGSLLRQLVEQTPRAERIADLSIVLNENAKYRDLTEPELFSWICTVSKDFNDVYIFVDALDECPELSRDALLLRLQQFSQLDQIHLLLTSRLNIDVNSRLQNISRIEIAASAADIETYLHSEIQKSSRLALFVRREPELKQAIVDSVIGKAHGMFLLASLQINSLCQQISPTKVRQALDGLPTGVFATYNNAFNRISNQPKDDADIAMKAISLVFCATRPLGVEELRHALAVQPGDCTLDTGAFTETEIILSTTVGLLSTFEVDDSKSSAFPTEVKFVHNTLQEYLEVNHERLFPTTERDMASICLTYLSFINYETDSPEVLDEQFEEFKFSTYAGYNWNYHLRGVQLELMEQILPFIEDKSKTYALVRRFPPDVRAWRPFLFLAESWTPALFAMIWNLADVLVLLTTGQSIGTTNCVCDMLMRDGHDLNAQDKDGQTPLHIAIRWSLFHAAMSRTDENLVELFLEHGADINTQDVLGYTPLHCAAFSGTPEIISMLMNRGASLTTRDYVGRVPLHCAASALYEDNINVLLRESEVNARDFKGRTPLHHAYIRWSILKHLTYKKPATRRSAITLLLEAGASDSIVDEDGRIPSDYSTYSDKEAGQLLRQGYQWIGL